MAALVSLRIVSILFFGCFAGVGLAAIDPNAAAKSDKKTAVVEEDLLSSSPSKAATTKGVFSQKVDIVPPKTFEREDQPEGSSSLNQIQRPQAQEIPSVPYNKKANRRALPWETTEDRDMQMSTMQVRQEGSLGLAASTGFSNSHYQSRMFFLYRVYSWLRVGLGAGYRAFDREGKRESVVSPALESMVTLPFDFPILPFLAVESGVDNWRRDFDRVLVESGSSPYSDLSLGVSIPLNSYVNLSIKQSNHVYLSKPPLKFQNNGFRERYAETRLSAGFGIEL